MASQDNFTKGKSPEGNRHKLKIKVLTMILEFMKSNYEIQEGNQKSIKVKLDELNNEWQKKNPNKKFKDYDCGKTLKPFLIKECGLQESMLDEFEIVPAAIEAKLQSMSDLPTQESDYERKAETATKKYKSKKQLEVGVSESEPEEMASQSNLIKSNTVEGDKHELKVKMLTMILDLLRNRYPIEEKHTIPIMIPLEELNTKWQKMSPNKKFKDYKCGKKLKQFLINECELQESKQNEFEIVPAAIHAKLQSMSDLPTQNLIVRERRKRPQRSGIVRKSMK